MSINPDSTTITPLKSPQEKIPTWTNIPRKEFEQGLKDCQSVLMGDHLVILAHDRSHDPDDPNGFDDDSSKPRNPEPAVLLAIDLRDTSIQEIAVKDFFYHENYSLTRYKDNQIIKFGGQNSCQDEFRNLYFITIESFKPLKVTVEEIIDDSEIGSGCDSHTAQIYQDGLYVAYSTVWNDLEFLLSRFDLVHRNWANLEICNESKESFYGVSSLLVDDELYLYGGKPVGRKSSAKNEIVALNLKSLTWKKFQQQQDDVRKQVNLDRANIFGDVWNGNLVILDSPDSSLDSETNRICCWNIANNSWSTHKVQKSVFAEKKGNLIVYKNLLLATASSAKQLHLGVLDLHNFHLQNAESPEEKHIRLLFMSEKESDVKFSIQNKTIPAHKRVLMDKSIYFAGLFESGMIESKQSLIDIKDCDYTAFQEYLRWIYCNDVELNTELAIKLIPLTDKYLQEDLHERCINYLTYNIDSTNVYPTLYFAIKGDFSLLITWCFNFLRRNLNTNNVSQLLEFIDTHTDLTSAPCVQKLRKGAVKVIACGYRAILKNQREKLPFYIDFMVRSIDMDTILHLIAFGWLKLKGPNDAGQKSQNQIEEFQASFEKETINLRKGILSFVQENWASIRANKILNNLPTTFWLDFCSSLLENPHKSQVQNEEKGGNSMNNEGFAERGRKRKEPLGEEEANSELKKTKKTFKKYVA